MKQQHSNPSAIPSRPFRRLKVCAVSWFAVGMCLLAGCDFPGQPNPADRPVPASEITSFEVLYRQNCSGCHGANGTLGPAPPLNDPMFLAIIPDEVLLRVIREGRPGTPMPPFAHKLGGTLTDEQIHSLVEGLNQWRQSASAVSTDLPPYLVGPGDAEAGAQLFATACHDCHGEDKRMEIRNAAFVSLISDQALRRLIITGRPDLTMPDFASSGGRDPDHRPLTSDEINNLVAYLATWRTSAARTVSAHE